MALKRNTLAERLPSVRGRSENHPDQLIEAASYSGEPVLVNGLGQARVMNPAERNGQSPAIDGMVGAARCKTAGLAASGQPSDQTIA